MEIAPDEVTKANVSGGAPIHFSTSERAFDSVMISQPGSFTFHSYLQHALLWGGFPGFQYISDALFNSMFATLPKLTLLNSALGSVLLVPEDGEVVNVVFDEILLNPFPTPVKISQLRKTLLSRHVQNATCELRDTHLDVRISIRIPRLFPRNRVLKKTMLLIRDIELWAKPMTIVIADDVLGKLRWCNPDLEGRLNASQTKIKTDLWIDLFVESDAKPQETQKNIARLRRFVNSWSTLEPRIKKEIMLNIYPEYHRCCDLRRDSIRHDEDGFWREFSVVSLSAKLDKTIVVRYHCGELFGSCRVEAAIIDDQVLCKVSY